MLILRPPGGARIVLARCPRCPVPLLALWPRARGACGGAVGLSSTRPTGRIRATPALDWRDQVIYQIMIDRFANGDPNNDFNVEPSVPGRYHGGDWQGVIDHLDYLQELGVTALWISPVVKNTEEDAGFASYHGYWTQDFLRPNAHFGDLDQAARAGRQGAREGHARDPRCGHQPHGAALLLRHQRQRSARRHARRRRLLAHLPADLHAEPGQLHRRRADLLRRTARATSSASSSGIPTTTRAASRAGPRSASPAPADIRFTDWPEQNRTPPPRPPDWFNWPDDKAWFDDPSWYHRRGRVYVWWHEADYSKDFVREQETTGDFPGGLKDLDTDNPDAKEALIRVVRVLDRGRRLRRLPHRHRQAHRSPRDRAQRARLLGRLHRSDAREGRRRSASRTSSSSARASTATTI